MFGKVGPPVNQQPADLSVPRISEDSRYEQKRQLVTVAHTFHVKCESGRYQFYVTILLGMRDAFEDQETEGRVVVEEVAVGGQIVCHRQPHSLSNDDDISTKVVHLVQSSIVAQYHASEYMSTISYNSHPEL